MSAEIRADDRHPTVVFEVTGFFGPPWQSADARPQWWRQEEYDAAQAAFRKGERLAHIPQSHYVIYRYVEAAEMDEVQRGDSDRAIRACPVCTPAAVTDNGPSTKAQGEETS